MKNSVKNSLCVGGIKLLVLNAIFQDFYCSNMNNHLIGFEKEDKLYIFKG